MPKGRQIMWWPNFEMIIAAAEGKYVKLVY
jgi:hypothetical protein